MRSAGDDGFAPAARLTTPCNFGVTTQDFWSGPAWRWDLVNSLKVKLTRGALAGASDAALLAGANALAIRNEDGGWEVVQFADAVLTAPGEYTLTRLKRGRRGSEIQMRDPVAVGARVVVVSGAQVSDGAGLAAELARSQASVMQATPSTWRLLRRSRSATGIAESNACV